VLLIICLRNRNSSCVAGSSRQPPRLFVIVQPAIAFAHGYRRNSFRYRECTAFPCPFLIHPRTVASQSVIPRVLPAQEYSACGIIVSKGSYGKKQQQVIALPSFFARYINW
jgi:hypothetical protein